MDRRRITGPEEAIPLVFATTLEKIKQNKENNQFFIKNGIIENANGSSYWEINNTSIIVSVYGPKPIRGSSLTSASLSVNTKLSRHISNLKIFKQVKQEKEDEKDEDEEEHIYTNQFGKYQLSEIEQKVSSYIHTSFLPSILLDKYPKSNIEIYVEILTNDSSLLDLLSHCANCCSLAIIDSGIEIKQIVSTGGCDEAVASFMGNVTVGMILEGDDLSGDKVGKILKECNNNATEVEKNINGYLMSQFS